MSNLEEETKVRAVSLLIFLSIVVTAGLLVESKATADFDEAATSFYPWSGYWWPHRSGGLTGPLSKYDQLLGTSAAAWERKEHVSPDVPEWFGHCHAWSAASVTEKEPKRIRRVRKSHFQSAIRKDFFQLPTDRISATAMVTALAMEREVS